MSGIDVKEHLSNLKLKIEKEQKEKAIHKLKFIIAICLSNFFVFTLTKAFNEKTEVAPSKRTHDHFIDITIEAESLVDPDEKGLISIIDKNQNLIVEDAYILNKENNKFKLEINPLEQDKIGRMLENKSYLVPHMKKTIATKVQKNKGEGHEILF